MAIWVALILGLLACIDSPMTGGVGAATAQDYTRIRKENEESVVFIHSRRMRKDGVGAAEDSYGTGFITSKHGHVLTASHVILKPDASTVVETIGAIRSRHNPKYKLEVVYRDEQIDAVLVMFPDIGVNWKPVDWGDSRSVPKDAPLYALGFPLNLDLSPATGILASRSAPRGIWQTTLGINRGHSGGPVFDMNAKVVAIAVAGIDTANNISFAIPESYVLGLRQIAAFSAVHPSVFTAGPSTLGEITKQKFAFYRSVDHQDEASPQELFCLPSGFKVEKVSYHITTQNGPGTRLLSVEPDPNATNCVALSAFIKGSGVTKIGPITVDHKGRGWLGAELMVEGRGVR